MKRSIIYKLNIEDIVNTLKLHGTVSAVLRNFSVSHTGGCYRALKIRLKEENINIEDYKNTEDLIV